VFFSNYVDDYFPLFEEAKAVIGSRLHASILALGMGIPAVNVNLDLRGTGFSETFGLTEWNVDYTAPRLGEALWERFQAIHSGRLDGLAAFARRREHYRTVYEAFMADTAARIRSAAGNGSGVQFPAAGGR
jgi:polysaccharide pyruvyl transferase WcaK-like protein